MRVLLLLPLERELPERLPEREDPLELLLPDERLLTLLPELRLEDVLLRTLLVPDVDLVDEVPLFRTTADRVLVVAGGEDVPDPVDRMRLEEPVVPVLFTAVLRCRRLLLVDVVLAAVDFASIVLRWEVVITEGVSVRSRVYLRSRLSNVLLFSGAAL